MLSTLERFHVADPEEVATFLNSAWERAYGPAVRPVFTEEYLRWLYGGPDAERTAIVGVRIDGRIAALKAMLSRELVVQGVAAPAYLVTHLTIEPTLSLAERVALQPLASDQLWLDSSVCDPTDFAYAVFDAEKPIARKTEASLARQGVSRVIGEFTQMVVAPTLIQRLSTSVVSRAATLDDASAIAELSRRFERSASLAVRLTPDRVRHHWFEAPGAEVLVTEDDDGLSGACCVYRLQTTRGIVAVIESLLTTSTAAGVALLRQVLPYATRVGARGVVLENATMIDGPREIGLTPTGRAMQLAVMSRRPVDIGTTWLVDVK